MFHLILSIHTIHGAGKYTKPLRVRLGVRRELSNHIHHWDVSRNSHLVILVKTKSCRLPPIISNNF